jgi:hypothetical protein
MPSYSKIDSPIHIVRSVPFCVVFVLNKLLMKKILENIFVEIIPRQHTVKAEKLNGFLRNYITGF